MNVSIILYNLLAVTIMLYVVIVGVRANQDDLHLTFEVENQEEFCLYQRFNDSIEYEVEFGVVKGGNFDIDFKLESPGHKILHAVQRSSKRETFKFTSTQMGEFTFCFNNNFSPVTHKIVYFSLKPTDEMHRDSLRQEAGGRGNAPSVLTSTEFRLESLHLAMENVSAIQQFYRIQELVDRNFADMLNQKIQVLSLVSSITIMVVSIGQVLFLKYLFNKKPSRSGPYEHLIINSHNNHKF